MERRTRREILRERRIMRIIIEDVEAQDLIKSYILSKLEGSVEIIGISMIDSEDIIHDLNNCQIQIITKEKG